MWDRLKLFLNPFDGRFEDLKGGRWYKIVFRDFTAGFIVAMVAIPLAMGFAMASGLRPEQGIVGGAVAGLVGALFGGSKYQVYGPTAAFIPVIAEIMLSHGDEDAAEGHAFLVLVSILAGIILLLMGLAGLGRFVAKVPHSIVVGFTIGIAVTIALSQVGEVLGLKAKLGYGFFAKCRDIAANVREFNVYALLLAAGTFAAIKYLLKVSIYIPAPLIAIGLGTLLSSTVLATQGLTLVKTRYGRIPTDFWVITPPGLPRADSPVGHDVAYFVLPELHVSLLFDIAYFTAAIVFVAAIESLLCSRMADRLADNRGQPFNPNKELWGQGLVNIIAPLLNGFPHTGALARTATNIKLGGRTPLAGIFKFALKLLLAAYLAGFLEQVPMACIGGVLLFVAFNMVKPQEVRQVLTHNRFHIALMVYTAIAVILTDFLTGVLTGIILYAVFYRFFDRPEAVNEGRETRSRPEAVAAALRDGQAASDDLAPPPDLARAKTPRSEGGK
jgi:MFS superfamily sulfate permease-like transporter